MKRLWRWYLGHRQRHALRPLPGWPKPQVFVPYFVIAFGLVLLNGLVLEPFVWRLLTPLFRALGWE